MDPNVIVAGGEILIAMAIFLATAGVVSVVLYKTAKLRPQAMIAISVSILTLVAVFGSIASGTEAISTALISLAGVGLGALAGALRTLFDVKQAEKSDEEAPPEPPQSQDPYDSEPS